MTHLESASMKTKSALAFFALYWGINFSVFAQMPASSAIPEGFHRTYAGKIGGKYSITMDLRKNGNKLIGSYKYSGRTKSLDLRGSIEDSGKFSMGESIDGKFTGTFSGKLSGDNILGEWEPPMAKGSNKMGFEAHQTAEFELKSKKEVLQDAIGTYALVSIVGNQGANGLFETLKTYGKWETSSSYISGGMREGQKNRLTSEDLNLLNSMSIKIDSTLAVQFFAKGKLILEIPFNASGMHYIGKLRPTYVVSPSTIFIGRTLYLASIDAVDFSKTINSRNFDVIATGHLAINYSPDEESFEMILSKEKGRGLNSLTFVKK